MYTEGFVNIHRKILEWEWYDDIPVYRLFLHLIFTANWTPGKWHGINILPGQIITSREKLAKETKLSEQQVRTALQKLETTEEITIKTTNRFTLITIVNYEFYQRDKGKATSKITNNQPTNNQQITNNQPQYNNNNKYNKDNKENNISVDDNLIQYYETYIGTLNSTTFTTIQSYIEDGMTEELIKQAIDVAVNAGVRKWNYIKKVLNNWYEANIKTIEDLKREESNYKNKNNKTYNQGFDQQAEIEKFLRETDDE